MATRETTGSSREKRNINTRSTPSSTKKTSTKSPTSSSYNNTPSSPRHKANRDIPSKLSKRPTADTLVSPVVAKINLNRRCSSLDTSLSQARHQKSVQGQPTSTDANTTTKVNERSMSKVKRATTSVSNKLAKSEKVPLEESTSTTTTKVKEINTSKVKRVIGTVSNRLVQTEKVPSKEATSNTNKVNERNTSKVKRTASTVSNRLVRHEKVPIEETTSTTTSTTKVNERNASKVKRVKATISNRLVKSKKNPSEESTSSLYRSAKSTIPTISKSASARQSSSNNVTSTPKKGAGRKPSKSFDLDNREKDPLFYLLGSDDFIGLGGDNREIMCLHDIREMPDHEHELGDPFDIFETNGADLPPQTGATKSEIQGGDGQTTELN